MSQNFQASPLLEEMISFHDLKHVVVLASRSMAKGEVLDLADALHDELRRRRDSAQPGLKVGA